MLCLTAPFYRCHIAWRAEAPRAMLHKLIKNLLDEGMLEAVRGNGVSLPCVRAFICLAYLLNRHHGPFETSWSMPGRGRIAKSSKMQWNSCMVAFRVICLLQYIAYHIVYKDIFSLAWLVLRLSCDRGRREPRSQSVRLRCEKVSTPSVDHAVVSVVAARICRGDLRGA